jgi:hypothetical protein
MAARVEPYEHEQKDPAGKAYKPSGLAYFAQVASAIQGVESEYRISGARDSGDFAGEYDVWGNQCVSCGPPDLRTNGWIEGALQRTFFRRCGIDAVDRARIGKNGLFVQHGAGRIRKSVGADNRRSSVACQRENAGPLAQTCADVPAVPRNDR